MSRLGRRVSRRASTSHLDITALDGELIRLEKARDEAIPDDDNDPQQEARYIAVDEEYEQRLVDLAAAPSRSKFDLGIKARWSLKLVRASGSVASDVERNLLEATLSPMARP